MVRIKALFELAHMVFGRCDQHCKGHQWLVSWGANNQSLGEKIRWYFQSIPFAVNSAIAADKRMRRRREELNGHA